MVVLAQQHGVAEGGDGSGVPPPPSPPNAASPELKPAPSPVRQAVEDEKKRAGEGMKSMLAAGRKLRMDDLKALKLKPLIKLLKDLGCPEEEVNYCCDKGEAIQLAQAYKLVYADQWEATSHSIYPNQRVAYRPLRPQQTVELKTYRPLRLGLFSGAAGFGSDED